MIDNFVFKDVWKTDNARAERDAIAVWQQAGDKLGSLTDEQRAKMLCVVGYDGDTVCGTATYQVTYFPRLRETMAFIQIFVARDYRRRGVAVPLTYAGHEAMSCYALEHPWLGIGGTVGRITVRGTMHRPETAAQLTLIAYSENDPVCVRWFDHFQFDEEAARARGPQRPQYLP